VRGAADASRQVDGAAIVEIADIGAEMVAAVIIRWCADSDIINTITIKVDDAVCFQVTDDRDDAAKLTVY
jgi:hypothetical protein